MVMHSRSGGLDGPTMIVMDVFALPVEGMEARVNAHEEAYQYMTTYTESCKLVGEAGLKMGEGGNGGVVECSQSMLCPGCSNNPGSDYILTHGNLTNGNLSVC